MTVTDGPGTKPAHKGTVDLDSLRGHTPDSVRIHPYNPALHAASRYEMEPDTQPPNYRPSKDIYFNIAKRKLYALLLGLVVGGIIAGAFTAIIVLICKNKAKP